MTAFLHFDKILQMPLIVVHELSGLSYRAMVEAFIEADGSRYPMIAEIRDFFLREAGSIQQGGPEYVYSPEWLGIYWPADEYVFIKLTAEKKFDGFYREAADLILGLVERHGGDVPVQAVQDAIRLNQALVKQPFVRDDVSVAVEYNVLEFCRGVREGEKVPLHSAASVIHVKRSEAHYDDFAKWCREVVWWGNKKGAYLYSNARAEKQLAGHY
jgi:hypothetical protein